MQIKVSLSEFEENTIYRSKKERYGESATGITPGFELATLIKSIDETKIEELEEIITQLKETSDTVRIQVVNWRISIEINEKLENLAARVNATKSNTIRGIIHIRACELKGNNENTSFSAAAWNINCGTIIPVNLIIDEVIRVSPDLFVLSSYNRAALGRGDLKEVLSEQGYAVLESKYCPGKKGFMLVYNSRRFKLIAEMSGAQTAFLPIAFRDNNCGRDIVFVCVKVPYNDNVKETLLKLDELVVELRQERFKAAEIIVAGDFRAIPSKIEEYGVLRAYSLCTTRNDEWSFVYESNYKNKIDHIFISNGLGFVDKAEYKWDFLSDDYNGLTAEEHINIPGMPNHAVIYSQMKYK